MIFQGMNQFWVSVDTGMGGKGGDRWEEWGGWWQVVATVRESRTI